MICKADFRIYLFNDIRAQSYLGAIEKNELMIFLSTINTDWIKVLHKGKIGYVYTQRRYLTFVTSADTLDP